MDGAPEERSAIVGDLRLVQQEVRELRDLIERLAGQLAHIQVHPERNQECPGAGNQNGADANNNNRSNNQRRMQRQQHVHVDASDSESDADEELFNHGN